MIALVVIFGLLIGIILNLCINILSDNVVVIDAVNDEKDFRWTGFFRDFNNLKLKSLFSGHIIKRNVLRLFSVIFLTAGLFFLSYQKFGFRWDFLVSMLLIYTFLFIAFIDLEHEIIPDALNLIILGLAIFSNLISGSLSIKEMFFGFLIGSGFLFLLALMGGIGGGDIKMMGAAGILLGQYKIVLALLIGFLAGAIVGVFLLIFKIKGRKDMIPFAPFLVMGVIISYLYFGEIIKFYLSFF